MAKTFDQRVAAGIKSMMDGTAYSATKATKLAGSVKTRAENLDVDMHVLGVASLGVIMDHSNTNPAALALNSLGRHTRAKAFAAWLETYSHVTCEFSKKSGLWSVKLIDQADRYDRNGLEDRLVKAIAEPFWTPEEKGVRDFSLHAALAALIKKAEVAKSKGKLDDAEVGAMATLADLAERVKPVAAPAVPADPLEVQA